MSSSSSSTFSPFFGATSIPKGKKRDTGDGDDPNLAEKLRHSEHQIMRLGAALADAEQQLSALQAERSGSRVTETAEDIAIQQSLLKRLQDINEGIDDLAFPIVQSFPDVPLTRDLVDRFVISRPRSGELVSRLAEHGLKVGYSTQDFLHPVIQTVILSVIFHNILGPFAPGLPRAQSDALKTVYKQISSRETQEASARWRTTTYLHSNATRNDPALVDRLCSECLGILQDSLTTFSSTHDLSSAAAVLPGIFLDAIKWQDTAKTACLTYDFEAYLASTGDEFANAVMHTYPNPEGEKATILALTGLGLRSWRSMRRIDQTIGKERKVIWKSAVVTTYVEPE